jgi:hypothetical protein
MEIFHSRQITDRIKNIRHVIPANKPKIRYELRETQRRTPLPLRLTFFLTLS